MTNSHSNQTTKLQGGAAFPVFEVPKFGGGTMTVGGATDGWTLLIVYPVSYTHLTLPTIE